jgi:creatinine amidohydrolase
MPKSDFRFQFTVGNKSKIVTAMYRRLLTLLIQTFIAAVLLNGQTNPLWHETKIKNYLPHMTWPEVQDLLARTDMVLIPVGSLEEHGPQTPIGTDYFSGVERAKLIAQKTDLLVAPIVFPGISPYHMEFPGTITLSHETLQHVYFEAVTSLIHHGFRRILLLNSHIGNQFMTAFLADRINQETSAIAIELGAAVDPLLPRDTSSTQFDRHAGVTETAGALYLFPNLVDLSKGGKNSLTLPDHLQKVLPLVMSGDRVATQVFLAESLKPKDTGKHTSTREMSATGVWSLRDTREATLQNGREATEAFVNASIAFIEKWKALRPLAPLADRQAK